MTHVATADCFGGELMAGEVIFVAILEALDTLQSLVAVGMAMDNLVSP